MFEMILTLDDYVIHKHKQLYANSCVTMGVELVLKLMNVMDRDSYELQLQNGDQQKSGRDFDGKIINGVSIRQEFDIDRGPQFPLIDLFNKIKSEIDIGCYVNCAWRPDLNSVFHAFVIYGYTDDEFLAVTKYHNNTNPVYINNMKSRLRDIQGSDIITFAKPI